MKNTLTLLLVLSLPIAQAQVNWNPTAKAKMRESLRILGMSTADSTIQKELDKVDSIVWKGGYMISDANRDKCRYVNMYLREDRRGKFASKEFGDYLITVTLHCGREPDTIEHPKFKGVVLTNCSYIVPQSAINQAEYVFYAPSTSQIKRLKGKDLETVREGGLLLMKMTKADRKKFGY